MKIISASQALQNVRRGAFSAWATENENVSGSNPNLASLRLLQKFAPVSFNPSFEISRDSKVFAMGSCFAREIELAFMRDGFRVLSFDDSVMKTPLFRGATTEFGSGSFLFRYTTASMKLEIGRLLDEIQVPDTSMLVGPPDELRDLNFGGDCVAGDIELISQRRLATKNMGSRIREADIVVLTLGLTEAWFDNESGLYLNSPPSLAQLRRGDRFELHSLDFDANLNNIETCIDLIKYNNANAKFVITVSPIPLLATFTSDDVIVANSRSKTMLRAVASTLTERRSDILYFPSYEIVTNSNPEAAWKPDRRHVTREMVDFIINNFKRGHLLVDKKPDFILTDMSNEKIITNTDSGSFSISYGNVLLHPASGKNSLVEFRSIAAKSIVKFQSTCHISQDKSNPVRFSVTILLNDGTGKIIGKSEVICPALQPKPLEIEVDASQYEEITVRLETEMADPVASTAYAWATFGAPTICYDHLS